MQIAVDSNQSPKLPSAKARLRQAVRQRRDAMAATEHASASADIACRVDIDVLALLSKGAMVALYANTQSEVATVAIERAALARGLRVCYPLTVAGQPRLRFCSQLATQLEIGRFGIAEPTQQAPVTDELEIAAVIIPAIAVDRSGGRIGWGKGYYDATLPFLRHALHIAVAFDCQWVVDVHSSSHDHLVNLIVTELESHRVPRLG